MIFWSGQGWALRGWPPAEQSRWPPGPQIWGWWRGGPPGPAHPGLSSGPRQDYWVAPCLRSPRSAWQKGDTWAGKSSDAMQRIPKNLLTAGKKTIQDSAKKARVATRISEPEPSLWPDPASILASKFMQIVWYITSFDYFLE